MSGRILVSAVGAVVEIDVSELESAASEAIRDAWRDALLGYDRDPDAVVRPRTDLDDAAMLSKLSTTVTLAALEHRQGELWMLHAAGLADERGHVVVLSARSGTGKTTASRHLARRFAYVSDETVGIDSQGGVVAYRKPLSLIVNAGYAKDQVPVSAAVAGPELPHALRLSKVVVLDRRDDAGPHARVEPLSLADAVMALAPQSSYLTAMRSPLRTIASLLDATGGAVRVTYREAESLDGVIDALMDAEPPNDPLVARPEARVDAATVSGAEDQDPDRWFRGPASDALDVGEGRLALLRRSQDGGKLELLDGIAPAIWRGAAGRTMEDISTGLIAEFGSPADTVDVEALVGTRIEELAELELLAAEPSWRITDAAAWVGDQERVTVMNVATGSQPLALDGSAAIIWTVLADGLALRQSALLEHCVAAFDIAVDSIRADVLALLDQLREAGVVTIR
ncbi:hypothetical protein GCM10025768_07380 [Microbacterium pseudoresistens]|uniref:PqqD family peptide modification chaperone n=1 Tax=Microbacterium pseudoresistens TaxID=640634 RepID=A0A7Y9JN07_9MICO|nr:PqqD family protein [Microbacterium pseudoresistens]NYD54576.1 hypothetical protein [Microbacterium pseudoresistens]